MRMRRSSKLRAKASRKRAFDQSAAEYRPGEDEVADVQKKQKECLEKGEEF